MARSTRPVLIAVAATGTVFGTIIGVIVLLGALAGVADEAWLWPGDGPTLDLSLILGLCGLAPASIGSALFWREMREDRLGRAARLPFATAIIGLGLMLMGVLIAGAGVGYRQTEAWRPVREAIVLYGDEVAADIGNRNIVLSSEQLAAMREKYLPQPLPVNLPGWGTVRIRMAHGNYPYVGVDFGEGRNAQFDPRTMLCIYSD